RKVPAPLKSLADQVIRSASSVPANLSEGHGRSGRDRIHHWRIAFASAKEVDSHLSLLIRAGAVDEKRAAESLDLFDQVRAMIWRLLYPRR
ncbi:MAG TPA: four helix bundle protein, partial [Candidatus Sulfomarinibacteraceae bacterium]|nr:four helix bundle protein [Candidatus Sulfomarinibacteraceae bacterium]